MFWGVTLQSGRRYSQVVQTSFHLSMAALELQTNTLDNRSSDYVSVMIDHGGTEFLLCNLQHKRIVQIALDLMFVQGEKICFFLNGEGTVHLTGYVINEDDSEEEEMGSDLSVDEEEESGEELPSEEVRKRKPSQSGENANPKKKMKNNALSPKQQKKTPPKKSPKVEVVETSGAGQKFSPSKSPFANVKASEPKKKMPQVNLESDDDDGEEESNWDDVSSDNESSLSDVSDVNQEDESESHMPKSTNTPGNLKDSLIVAKNKKAKKFLESGDTKNQNLLGKQDQKKISPKKETPVKMNILDSPKSLQKRKLQGGVEVEDAVVGNGPLANPGKYVHVYYTGKLSDGREFDSVKKGKPFSFRLGKGAVIKGWDIAIQGMKVGGKRKIVIPAHMGYGNKAQGPIPANSILYFDVELKAVS